MLEQFRKLAFVQARHDGLIESARVEVRAGWIRIPLALAICGLLMLTSGLALTILWLAAVVAIEVSSYFVARMFLGAGGPALRLAYYANSTLVCVAWTAYTIMIWTSGTEAARLAAVAGIFSLALYAVMVCHHDAKMLVLLLVPPCVTMLVLMVGHGAQNGTSLLLTLQPALAFIGVLGVTGWICHSSYQRRATAQESLAQERNLLERRVAERTAELEGAMVRAEAAHAVKAQFLAKMSHELRTPLNAIINYAEIVQEDLSDGDDTVAHADIQRIHAAGRHLLGLIENLLNAASAEGALSAERATTNVAELLRETIKTVTPAAELRSNLLDVQIGPDLEAVWTDAKLLRQCTLHLLANANKFTEAGHIRLEARHEGRMLVISVTDTGIGIAPGQLATLFQPFHQGDNSLTRQFEGAGLGLVITRRLAEALDGTISCESRLGEGACFTLRFPRIDPPLARAA